LLPSAEMPAVARHCQPVPVTPTLLSISHFYPLLSIAYFRAYRKYHEKYHAQKFLENNFIFLLIARSTGSAPGCPGGNY
ncbi:hypothetical protein, partial [Acinetobacter baumannii]